MKNKKLFAILTLVCFMFTLMPVAAFAASYAEVNEDDTVVAATEAIQIDIPSATTDSYIVFAMKDGNVNKDLGFSTLSGALANDYVTIPGGTLPAGTYEVFVVEASTRANNIVTRYNDGIISAVVAAADLKAESGVTMLENTVVVSGGANAYAVKLYDSTMTLIPDNTTLAGLKANSGFDDVVVYAELTNNGDPVVGEKLTIDTNSAGITVTTSNDSKTNAAGLVKVTLAGSISGDFKLYAEYGTRADDVVTVKVTAMDPANIEFVYAPTAPTALGVNVDYNLGVTFDVTDANGNAIVPVYDNANTLVNPGMLSIVDDSVNGNYKIVVTEKPAGSSINADNLRLFYNDGWLLHSAAEDFDKEGTYTFKVVLGNGDYATASVEVKEFQYPVELRLTYKQNTVELDGVAKLHKVLFADANGVTRPATTSEYTLSATGYAVANFDGSDVKVKADEKYVGSKITVLAVSEKYNLTDSVELVVANEAAGVKWATNTADVAVNNTIVANIVDVDGNKVALNSTAGSIQYIVLDKPADAKVAVSTKTTADLAAKGEFKVSFTASAIGEYKVQTVVKYEQATGVVKYYSGIETITVGNTGFEDVVVLSIGSSTIVVNADAKAIDAAPVVENGRTFVPFRALAEAFGANVAYDEATQAVTAELDGITVVMTIGSATYTVNGVEATADVAPFIVDGRTMVPVRFVAEAFGITVTPTYDENGATADVIFAK